jgi:transposase InsO family protein
MPSKMAKLCYRFAESSRYRFGSEVEGQAYCDVIGWTISKRIDAKLCLAALKSALDTRQHSDRGVHSTPLEGANMEISMSRTGNPYDVRRRFNKQNR